MALIRDRCYRAPRNYLPRTGKYVIGGAVVHIANELDPQAPVTAQPGRAEMSPAPSSAALPMRLDSKLPLSNRLDASAMEPEKNSTKAISARRMFFVSSFEQYQNIAI